MEYNRTNTDFEYSYTVKLILLEFVNRYASVFYVAFFKGKFIARPGKYNTIFGYRQEEVSAWILINFRFCVYFYVMIITILFISVIVRTHLATG